MAEEKTARVRRADETIAGTLARRRWPSSKPSPRGRRIDRSLSRFAGEDWGREEGFAWHAMRSSSGVPMQRRARTASEGSAAIAVFYQPDAIDSTVIGHQP